MMIDRWCQLPNRFFVDDIPIRVFKNCKDLGVRFPFNQPMKIYSSLWNADDWATRGGLEKTDWSKAPFIASYKGFHIDGCEASVQAKYCATQGKRWWDQKEFQDLDAFQYRRLKWVRSKFTIYNYCTDRSRFPVLPPECRRDRDIWRSKILWSYHIINHFWFLSFCIIIILSIINYHCMLLFIIWKSIYVSCCIVCTWLSLFSVIIIISETRKLNNFFILVLILQGMVVICCIKSFIHVPMLDWKCTCALVHVSRIG